MDNRVSVVYRFAAKVHRTEAGCWEWGGCLSRRGYPLIQVNGRPVLASRLAYRLQFGRVPPGVYLKPACGNRCCVNPSHRLPSARASLRLGRMEERPAQASEGICKIVEIVERAGW